MRLLHVVAFSKKLSWLAQTKVIILKTQLHAVNACVNRLSQLSFINMVFVLLRFGLRSNKILQVYFILQQMLLVRCTCAKRESDIGLMLNFLSTLSPN